VVVKVQTLFLVNLAFRILKPAAERFVVSGKTMHKIGVVFSSGGKGMLGWKIG
jgi:hypothetical protein